MTDQIASYASLNDDEKLDLLNDYPDIPTPKFIKHLITSFYDENDEFVQVEIAKFIGQYHIHHSQDLGDLIKSSLLSWLYDYANIDEMVLCYISYSLDWFKLYDDELQNLVNLIVEIYDNDDYENLVPAIIHLVHLKDDSRAFIAQLNAHGVHVAW